MVANSTTVKRIIVGVVMVRSTKINNYFDRKGSRLEINKTKVSQTKNGQFRTTIPKFIADALNIKKGDVLVFDKEEDYIIVHPESVS